MNEFINVVLQTWMQIISSILWQWNDSNFYTKQTYNDTLEIRLSACMVEDTKIFIEDQHATMKRELKILGYYMEKYSIANLIF